MLFIIPLVLLAAYPWLRPEDACAVDWAFPSTPEEKTRYFTFKDLWGKGFYITTGHKFGGDFLVYPGNLTFISLLSDRISIIE